MARTVRSRAGRGAGMDAWVVGGSGGVEGRIPINTILSLNKFKSWFNSFLRMNLRK
jgi:hypothetical protein